MKAKSGDTFDSMTFEKYGSSNNLIEVLRANREKLKMLVLKAGTDIEMPEIETKTETILPEWRL